MFCIAWSMWIVLSISKQIKPAVSKYTVAGYSGLCGNQFKQFMLLHISWVNWISDKSSVTSLGSSCKSRKNPHLCFWSQVWDNTFTLHVKELKEWEFLHRRHKKKKIRQWESLSDCLHLAMYTLGIDQGIVYLETSLLTLCVNVVRDPMVSSFLISVHVYLEMPFFQPLKAAWGDILCINSFQSIYLIIWFSLIPVL